MTTDTPDRRHQSGSCHICHQQDPLWRFDRRGDAVVSWACADHLSAVCEALQRDWEISELVVVLAREAREWRAVTLMPADWSTTSNWWSAQPVVECRRMRRSERTPVSDLVSRVLSAIDERERAARAATQQPWQVRWFDDDHAMNAIAITVEDADDDPDHDQVVGVTLYQAPRVADIADGRWKENAAHIALNDPRATLRLCQAHRDIVEEYQKAVMHERWLMANHSAGVAAASDAVRTWLRALQALARGYGIEDGCDGG